LSIVRFVAPISIVALITATANAAEQKPWEAFSGEKALAHVQHLVDIGPHPPASPEIEKARLYIEQTMKSCGWTVKRQEFTDDTPRGKVRFVNLIADFGGGKIEPRFVVCSHYDTKIFPFPFVGANDGGSSTGVLLELARVLAEKPELARKIDIVFFDGEEAVEEFSETDGDYGSRHFAKELNPRRYRGGILFDMVGDRSLRVTLPLNSPRALAQKIFAAADTLHLRDYFTYFGGDITDDHTPLNAAGVPTIDIIDFDYQWWHTAEDKIDKISAESLDKVGKVGAYFLSELAFK
jgi:glutaminyl-peptide cyclotransferase